jgi:hypothetical protein
MDARTRRVLGGRPSCPTASNESLETSIHEAWESGLDRAGDKILDADHGVKGGFAAA